MKNKIKTVAIDDTVIDNLTGLINSFIEFNNELYINEFKTTQKNNGVTMEMNFELFEKLLTDIYSLHQELEAYNTKMHQLDRGFSNYLIESPAVLISNRISDKLMSALFGQMLEDVLWFLYDWKEGYEIEVDGKKYIINNLDDYLAYVKAVYYSE